MKKLIFFLFAVLIFLGTACSQQADVNTMLKNAENQGEVFSTILSDHEMMTEFMNKMMSNKHAMMMMKGNQEMMGKMMGENDMMKMMKEKPEMMHKTMSDMMKDGKMMGHIMQMMQQEGMMSEECMQSCMKMMDDKGMSINMDMMENSNTEKEGKNQDSHH